MSAKTSLSQNRLYGLPSFVLETDAVKAVFIPSLGFKLASFVHKASDRDAFLAPNCGDYVVPDRSGGMPPFSRFDTSGCDDMLPTIDACELNGKALPDHGEAWSRGWDVKADEEAGCLYGSIALDCLPLRLERSVRFADERTLRMEYRLFNHSGESVSYLWALHPLFAMEEDTRLHLPKGTGRVENVHASEFLGEPGDLHPWPLAAPVIEQEFDMAGVGKYPPNSHYKFYVKGGLFRGAAALEYPKDGLSLALSFDPAQLPYLGVWLSTGGFRGLSVIAIEPASAFCDSPENARQNKTESVLAPHSDTSWALELAWTPTDKLLKTDYAR